MNLFAPTPYLEWREVPQALFLSWSEARQLTHCAARDEDSAAGEDVSAAEARWYLERARTYRMALNTLKDLT